MSGDPKTAIWANPEQCELLQRVALAARLSITSAGSPLRAQSATVASQFGAATADDLRTILNESDADLVLLASAGDFGHLPEDARAISAARSRGLKIASLEPIPASVLDMDAAGWTAPAASEPIRFLGLPRQSRAMREGAEVLASFGQARTILIESWGGSAHGSLGARVFWGLDLALALLGEPDLIDAAHHPPGELSARTPAPTSLSTLHGDFTATLRGPNGRLALLAASDQAGRWNNTATLISDQGRLRFYDDGFEWVSPDGQKRDELRIASRREGAAIDHSLTAISESLTRLLDPSLAQPAPVDVSAVLGAAQAALLSARTGQPESPRTIRRMMAVGESLQ